jgi:hypothetical protein
MERRFRGRGRGLMLLVTGAAALLVVASAGAYVTTDQQDYAPGSTVVISGDSSSGASYSDGNAVDVAVSGPNGWAASCSATVADGAWSCEVTLDSDPDVAAGDYSYTATQTDAEGTVLSSEDGTFTDTPPVTSTTTTLFVSPNTITYGEHTFLSGTLSSDTALGGKTINLSWWTGSGCTGTQTTIGTATTAGGNTLSHAWPDTGTFSYTPQAAGTEYVQAAFAAQGVFGESSDCKTLTISKAPTTTSITNTPLTTLALGNSLTIDYEVKSAYGISGNTTRGSVVTRQLTDPGGGADLQGSGDCKTAVQLNEAQANADNNPTTEVGFSKTGSFTCRPTAVGTYTYDVKYDPAGGSSPFEGNYSGSDSADGSVTVEQATVQVCKAAPAIAVEYMQSQGVKPGSKKWKDVVTDVAMQTGVNGDFFAKNVCDSSYAPGVIDYVHGHWGV